MEEMLDVYDKNGNYLGIRSKSFCHGPNPGVYYKPVWLWIINSNKEVLLQRRAPTKKFFPNKWDHPVGGHVHSGEDFISACQREAKEELGIDIKNDTLIYLGEFLEQTYWHIGRVYLLEKDISINDITIDTEELCDAKWFSFEEFKNILFSSEFGPFETGYKEWVVETLTKYINKK
jgi:isopentenyldiphosphate isomerase